MSQIESFNESAVLITDLSNVCKSFSALTGRPSIFFRPWLKTCVQNPKDFILLCNTYENLGKEILNILDNPETASNRVKNMLANKLAPIDNSFDRLADYLPDFMREKTPPEDICIAREKRTESVCEIISRLEAILSGQSGFSALTVFRYNHQESPLLAAYCLHKNKLEMPSSQLIFKSGEYTGKILGKKITAKTYADIETADVETL